MAVSRAQQVASSTVADMTKRERSHAGGSRMAAIGGFGLVAVLAWIVKMQSMKEQGGSSLHVAADLTNGGIRPGSGGEVGVFSAAEATYMKARTLERKKFGQKTVGMLMLSLFLLVFIALSNVLAQGIPIGKFDKAQLDTGIEQTDATVIVVGLLTVVAALGIALAVNPTSSQSDDVKDEARAAAWAYNVSGVTLLAAMTSLAIGLTQLLSFIARGKPGFGLVLALIAMGVITVLVASSIQTSPSGMKYSALQYKHNNMVVRSSADESFADFRKLPDDHIRREYVRFVILVALGTAAVQVGLVFARSSGPREHLMMSFVALLGLSLVSAARVWTLVSLTIQCWTLDFWPQLLERLPPKLLRGALIAVTLLMDAYWLTAWTGPDEVVKFGSPLISAVGSTLLPLAFLRVARLKGRGPARFAIVRTRTATYRRLQEDQQWAEAH